MHRKFNSRWGALVLAAVLTVSLPFAERTLAQDAGADIIDTASRAEGFGTLLTALDAAGLTETLRGEGPFTVFAPTNEAFEALPEGTLDGLLAPENSEQLTDVLGTHVVGHVPLCRPDRRRHARDAERPAARRDARRRCGDGRRSAHRGQRHSRLERPDPRSPDADPALTVRARTVWCRHRLGGRGAQPRSSFGEPITT